MNVPYIYVKFNIILDVKILWEERYAIVIIASTFLTIINELSD